MNHAREGGTGAGAIVVLLDQHHVDALQRQLAEDADAVDAAADDEHGHFRAREAGSIVSLRFMMAACYPSMVTRCARYAPHRSPQDRRVKA
jgi:uncharacterized membrane protein affecting hemolysin expression